MAETSRNRMKRLVTLWHEGKISGLEFNRRARKLAETKPQVDKRLKKRLAKIDRKHNPRPKRTVLVGCPNLASVDRADHFHG
jgi:hypothetical protein